MADTAGLPGVQCAPLRRGLKECHRLVHPRHPVRPVRTGIEGMKVHHPHQLFGAPRARGDCRNGVDPDAIFER